MYDLHSATHTHIHTRAHTFQKHKHTRISHTSTHIHTYIHTYIHKPQDEQGHISRQNLESFFREELAAGLPPNASEELRNRLIKESVETAIESIATSTGSDHNSENSAAKMVGMTEEQAEKWLQNHPKEESFFSDFVTAKILRENGAERGVVPVHCRMPRLSTSSLLCECVPPTCTNLSINMDLSMNNSMIKYV